MKITNLELETSEYWLKRSRKNLYLSYVALGLSILLAILTCIL